MAGTRILAAVSGAVALAASLIYTLTVTRRLPTQDLALLTLYNSAYAVAAAVVGYATTWYPRVLAKDPGRLPELAAAGILVALAAVIPLAAYLALYGRPDPVLLALGTISLIILAWPVGAYIAIYKQRLSVVANFANQLIKIAGAYAIRNNPSVYAVIGISIIISLPQILAKLVKPRFRNIFNIIKTFIKGAPYQTLYLVTVSAGGLITYATLLAGGDKLLSYSFIFFQLGKSIFPAMTILSLMYGSLLKEHDKLRRALFDGAITLYLVTALAVIMAKTPQWYIAILRPAELNNTELLTAVELNAYTFLLWGINIHLDTVLKGVEEKEIFTLRDKPAKAMLFDLTTTLLNAALTYILSKTYGAVGLVLAPIIPLTLSIAYRNYLLGRGYIPLTTKLYLPAILTLITTEIAPIPLPPFSTSTLLETIIGFVPTFTVLATITALTMLALSPPVRQLLKKLIKATI